MPTNINATSELIFHLILLKPWSLRDHSHFSLREKSLCITKERGITPPISIIAHLLHNVKKKMLSIILHCNITDCQLYLKMLKRVTFQFLAYYML